MDTRNNKSNEYIYAAFAGAPEGRFQVKIGRTNHPEHRVRQYLTHCPGGLSSMYAYPCGSHAHTVAVERAMLHAMRNSALVKPLGGEWFLVHADRIQWLFDTLRVTTGHSPHDIDVRRIEERYNV